MKIKPVREKTIVYHDVATYENILECCDSYIAVLNQEQIDMWFNKFEEISASEDAQEYTDFGTTSLVFEVDDKNLVVVSDSGGEYSSGYFAEFCESHNIDCQFIIDSLECEGIDLDEIYTGDIEENKNILKLLHKIYN